METDLQVSEAVVIKLIRNSVRPSALRYSGSSNQQTLQMFEILFEIQRTNYR